MEEIKPNKNEIQGMFEGPILPLALKLSIPFFISNVVGLLYLVIDTYFITLIDRSSTALISGTGLVFPVYFLFLALGMGINIGVSSLVARAIGEKNQPALERAADSGLLIATVLAVSTLTLGYVFGSDILHLLAGSKLTEEAVGHGLRFFYFILPALGLLLLGHVLLGVLQGEGLTRYIATASVLSAVVNIALDPLLIFYFDMGVAGAGLATTLGIAVAAVYVIGIFAREKSSIPIHWNLTKARAKLIMEILRVGSVQSLQMAAMSVTFMFLNNIVSSIGQDAMNSWALCGRTDQIMFIPAFAISGATISMVGQNYGRGNLARVRRIYSRNILLGLVMVLSLAVVYNITAGWIFSGFSSVEGVIQRKHFPGARPLLHIHRRIHRHDIRLHLPGHGKTAARAPHHAYQDDRSDRAGGIPAGLYLRHEDARRVHQSWTGKCNGAPPVVVLDQAASEKAEGAGHRRVKQLLLNN